MTKSSDYRTLPIKDEVRAYIARWLLEFGPDELDIKTMLLNRWYSSTARWNPVRLDPYMKRGKIGYYVTQKGLNLLKGEDTDKSTCP